MLIGDETTMDQQTQPESVIGRVTQEHPPSIPPRRLEKVLSIEWLGQTVASVCWIGSVFTIGISSSGDWLQLVAGASWLMANIAALGTVRSD